MYPSHLPLLSSCYGSSRRDRLIDGITVVNKCERSVMTHLACLALQVSLALLSATRFFPTLLPFPTASGPSRFDRKRSTLVLLVQYHDVHYDSLVNRHITLGLKNVSNAVLGQPPWAVKLLEAAGSQSLGAWRVVSDQSSKSHILALALLPGNPLPSRAHVSRYAGGRGVHASKPPCLGLTKRCVFGN
jgi:hypothetical protein